MGLVGVPENGNGETGVSLALGSKNKYRRMDSELTEDDDHYLREERKSTIRKYVFACAVFASLNNVLLGYGKLLYYDSISNCLCCRNYWQ